MKETVSIFWFRRDLRLHDNAGLYVALKNIAPVLPIFIFDTELLDKLPKNDARVTFIYQSLQKLRKKLQSEANSSIAVYHGKPIEIIKKLLENYTIKAVFTNND
ncbi:MAG: deoxyribodipyrimidine photo-lyase, partial [Bacteroidota bacterium]